MQLRTALSHTAGPGDQTLIHVTHLDTDCQAPVFTTLNEKDVRETAFLGCLSASF